MNNEPGKIIPNEEFSESEKNFWKLYQSKWRSGLNRKGEIENFNLFDRCEGRCHYWSGECECCKGTVYTDDDKEFDYDLSIVGESYRLHHDWEDDDDDLITEPPEKIQKIEGIFKPTNTFNGYQMTFLKEFKTLVLPDPVTMDSVMYGYYFTDANLSYLKDELSQINVELESEIQTDRRIYVRANNLKFNGTDVNIDNIKCEGLVKIKVLLQGYKENNGIKSPIWKLIEINN